MTQLFWQVKGEYEQSLTTRWNTRCTARILRGGLFGSRCTHGGCTPYTCWRKTSVDSEAPGICHSYDHCSVHCHVWPLSSSHPANLSSNPWDTAQILKDDDESFEKLPESSRSYIKYLNIYTTPCKETFMFGVLHILDILGCMMDPNLVEIDMVEINITIKFFICMFYNKYNLLKIN